MFKNPLTKSVFIRVAIIAVLFALCYFTTGYGIIGVVLYGLYAIIRKKPEQVLFVFFFMPFLCMVNPYLFPRDENFSRIVRVAIPLISVFMFINMGNTAKRGIMLPLQSLYFYIIIAFVSSMEGYAPLISYLKILNFVFYIMGLYLLSGSISNNKDALFDCRALFIAYSVVVVFGAIATLPFPSIAYYTSLRGMISEAGLEFADAYYDATNGRMSLFSGFTVHSQYLGPLLAFVFAFIASDMLFCEKKVNYLHIFILAPIPILIYMTRARVGVLTFLVYLTVLAFYLIKTVDLGKRTRQHLINLLIVAIFVFTALCVKYEYEKGAISSLVRKTNQNDKDSRSLVDAATSSRIGLVYESLDDYKKRPLLGMGFQVVESHKQKLKQSYLSYFSAPIEKGVLPIMILGETGIIGAVAFCYFLYLFITKCKQNKLFATITAMLVFLASNMAEAVFFSPGGGGGVFWIFSVVAGFVIDNYIRINNSHIGIKNLKVGIHRKFFNKKEKIIRIPL